MCRFIALVALGMFLAGSALAHEAISVHKNADGSGFAFGSVVAGQESGGSVDCFTVDSLLMCRVVEASGEAAFCSSSDKDQLAAVRGLPDDACIWMAFDRNGTCTAMITATGTHYHPE